jgi:galactokinase
MKDIMQAVVQAFRTRYGVEPRAVVRAPGRVNLIGEHTDYNDGFVLPMAIERATWIALRPRDDVTVELHSLDHAASAVFGIDDLQHDGTWREYPRGVAHVLRRKGYDLKGFDGVTACDVPLGAGLSSSASFELAVARAFAVSSDLAWDAPAMARLCQQAENEWVGVNCGIMDQMIAAVGEAGRAVLIDCRDLSRTAAPLPEGTAVVIMDTATRRGLVDSAYNERRRQCGQAAAHFGVRALRDLDAATLARRAGELDPVVLKRARHVVTENARTLAAQRRLAAGDAAAFGRMMNESHDSLRDDFEVSNEALNAIVEAARGHAACLGARMTGAGFGGCAVALIHAAQTEAFTAAVARQYRARTGLTPALYATRAAAGASREA